MDEISTLHEKDTYLNKDIEFIFNKVIIEYDLHSANTSLCKEYNLLDSSVIKDIEKMNKKKRVVTIGKMMRKDSDFKEGIKRSFKDIRKRFFEANKITNDQLLSIKKDAIFTLKECKHTVFGECEFVEKNIYSSYIYLNKFELYYKSGGIIPDNGVIHVKGIDDDTLKKHEGYLLEFFKRLFDHLENGNYVTTYGFLSRFIYKYKTRQLPVGFYREFNQESVIRLMDSDETYDMEEFIPYEHKQEYLLIDYNFSNILLPIVKMIM